MNLTEINTVKRLLRRHGFNFSKSLGQNFLIDGEIPEKTARCANIDGAGVLEIGPGIGALTAELSRRAVKVVAVEIDRALKPLLEETLSGHENIQIVYGDILKLNLHELIKEEFGGMRVCVCANLPYYISTPIIMRLLESGLPIESATVMLQKEVALRLCAKAGSSDYGAISCAVQYYSRPEIQFFIEKESFLPQPKVSSAVLKMEILKAPPVSTVDKDFMFKIIKAAFGQRRKTLLNAISGNPGLEKERVSAAMAECGLLPLVRGEELSLREFAELADKLFKQSGPSLPL